MSYACFTVYGCIGHDVVCFSCRHNVSQCNSAIISTIELARNILDTDIMYLRAIADVKYEPNREKWGLGE